MHEPVHTETVGNYVIKIFQDCDAESPRHRDYDSNLGTIYHTHSRYDLSEHMDIDDIQAIVNDSKYFTLPLYMKEFICN